MPRVIHFEIHASNPQALIDYYRALFGWIFKQWGTIEYWTITTGDPGQPGIDGGLVLRRGEKPSAGQAVTAFICTVQVDSLDESVSKSLSLGGTIALPKMPIPGVGWLAYVKDPDGNILGLMQPDTNAG
jgi:predicted enzyme related to lactoylglutathione lyase